MAPRARREYARAGRTRLSAWARATRHRAQKPSSRIDKYFYGRVYVRGIIGKGDTLHSTIKKKKILHQMMKIMNQKNVLLMFNVMIH